MLSYRCFICHRPPSCFGWLDSDPKQTYEQLRASYKRFCSMVCQDIHYQLYRKVVAMSRIDFEQKAAESVLEALADYVVSIDMDRGLGDYTKAEIIGLVDVVLNAYHTALQKLYKDQVPSDAQF